MVRKHSLYCLNPLKPAEFFLFYGLALSLFTVTLPRALEKNLCPAVIGLVFVAIMSDSFVMLSKSPGVFIEICLFSYQLQKETYLSLHQ